MPDDHSKLAPLLPIPNRTVKRLSADDSADSRVKVGHRQALTASIRPTDICQLGVLFCVFAFYFLLSKGLFSLLVLRDSYRFISGVTDMPCKTTDVTITETVSDINDAACESVSPWLMAYIR